jgi:hypothetical protein
MDASESVQGIDPLFDSSDNPLAASTLSLAMNAQIADIAFTVSAT